MNDESKKKPEVSEHSQTATEYCCSCNSEEMDEYFPKFEPLPLYVDNRNENKTEPEKECGKNLIPEEASTYFLAIMYDFLLSAVNIRTGTDIDNRHLEKFRIIKELRAGLFSSKDSESKIKELSRKFAETVFKNTTPEVVRFSQSLLFKSDIDYIESNIQQFENMSKNQKPHTNIMAIQH